MQKSLYCGASEVEWLVLWESSVSFHSRSVVWLTILAVTWIIFCCKITASWSSVEWPGFSGKPGLSQRQSSLSNWKWVRWSLSLQTIAFLLNIDRVQVLLRAWVRSNWMLPPFWAISAWLMEPEHDRSLSQFGYGGKDSTHKSYLPQILFRLHQFLLQRGTSFPQGFYSQILFSVVSQAW